jgi:hypothetical protein
MYPTTENTVLAASQQRTTAIYHAVILFTAVVAAAFARISIENEDLVQLSIRYLHTLCVS